MALNFDPGWDNGLELNKKKTLLKPMMTLFAEFIHSTGTQDGV